MAGGFLLTLAPIGALSSAASRNRPTTAARWARSTVLSDPVVHDGRAQRVSRPVRAIAPRPRAHAHRASSEPGVFEGMSNRTTISPPDPNGDVSATQYVQAVNSFQGARIAVYDKATGAIQRGPFHLQELWSRGRCARHGEGDPVVQYDPLAQRWVLTQFAFAFDASGNPVGPYSECIAVSTSSDATGTYYPYSYRITEHQFPDFPKFGVWPDGYYMSIHLYASNGAVTQGVIAFDRQAMLDGTAGKEIVFFVHAGLFGLLPSDIEGTTAPPVGAPNYLVLLKDDDLRETSDRMNLYAFFTNWAAPSKSHIDGTAKLPTEPTNSNLCHGNFFCLAQQGTRMRIDAIAGTPRVGVYLMYPLVYRNFGDHEALVVQHTVKVGPRHAGINWFEVRDPSGSPYIYQQGTYGSPDLNRWVGSIGLDAFGDIAMAYSTSSAHAFPSIAYTGRLASDPLGQMTYGDNVLVAGGGSQTATPRWGDYTAMSVDPVDDCTFWFTDEFYPSSAQYAWHTAITSFSLPTCSGASSSPSPSPSS